MIRKSLLGTVAIVTLSSVAFAGGMTEVQVVPAPLVAPVTAIATTLSPDWAGGYVGFILGTNSADSSTGDITTTDDPAIVIPGISYASDGFSAGVELGYNFQSNAMVYGVELDASTASIEGSFANFLDDGQGTNFSVSTNADWIASARGRIGYASERTLFYATGGIAAIALETQLTDSYNNGTTVFTPSVSETRTGWVAGVGAEFMLNQDWSLKAEYLHYDFGSDNESFVEGEDRTITTDATFINDQVRVGLNYAF